MFTGWPGGRVLYVVGLIGHPLALGLPPGFVGVIPSPIRRNRRGGGVNAAFGHQVTASRTDLARFAMEEDVKRSVREPGRCHGVVQDGVGVGR